VLFVTLSLDCWRGRGRGAMSVRPVVACGAYQRVCSLSPLVDTGLQAVGRVPQERPIHHGAYHTPSSPSLRPCGVPGKSGTPLTSCADHLLFLAGSASAAGGHLSGLRSSVARRGEEALKALEEEMGQARSRGTIQMFKSDSTPRFRK
jgi:hypothetical protein